MDLQKFLKEAFKTWKPDAPSVLERGKSYVTLSWCDPGPFHFIQDQFIFRLERNNKMPPWVVEYSGGKTKKTIDNLAPRHPYRFRLRVILKATAVPKLADNALKYYGDDTAVYNDLKQVLNIDDFKEVVKEKGDKVDEGEGVKLEVATPDSSGDGDGKASDRNRSVQPWLTSQWSEEVWTSTDTDGTSAVCFCMAVRCGYTKQIQVMLEERPALIGIVNSANGFTPLATAVRKGDINTVKLLLASGAELEQPSSAGQTALHLAVLGRQPAIVELLIEKGADFKARDVNGLQVEHYAVDSCDVDMLRLVLDRGGDVTAADNNGWTPLFRALCQGASTAIIEELMMRGSDPGIKDHAGLPLTSVARLLKNRHGRSRDSILRLVDCTYPHEKALANFTRLTKKIYNVHTMLK